jgi:hypothetical protein
LTILSQSYKTFPFQLAGQLISESLMGVEEDLERVEKEEIIKDRFQEDDSATTAERVKGLIEDCKKLLIPDLESVVGAWGLIDSDPVTGNP